jgi:3-phosphoshikimate 1-carboxyvinyltransferase
MPAYPNQLYEALIAAALADGTSRLSGVRFSGETRAMIEALRLLGVPIRSDERLGTLAITGSGGHWRIGEASFVCVYAGAVPFLAAACCVGIGLYQLDGNCQVRQEPIEPMVNGLRDLGAAIGYADAEGYLPITIRASGLNGGTLLASPGASDDWLRALLLVSPFARTDVFLDLTGPADNATDLSATLQLMASFGVSVVADETRRIIVPAPQRYRAEMRMANGEWRVENGELRMES